jgi:hypothetical protein
MFYNLVLFLPELKRLVQVQGSLNEIHFDALDAFDKIMANQNPSPGPGMWSPPPYAEDRFVQVLKHHLPRFVNGMNVNPERSCKFRIGVGGIGVRGPEFGQVA